MRVKETCIQRLRQLSQSCYIDFPKEKETIFFASSGRSGTTWIQEMLTRSGDYRVMFEPFHSILSTKAESALNGPSPDLN